MMEKAGDAKDFITEKATMAKDTLVEKIINTKDFIMEKAIDAKDYVTEKTEHMFGESKEVLADKKSDTTKKSINTKS